MRQRVQHHQNAEEIRQRAQVRLPGETEGREAQQQGDADDEAPEP